jgi:ribonuclease HI
MEYRDERDLHIYTDGSSYSGPRRGGVGILYVAVDASGEERAEPYPRLGYVGATNQQMELRAAIDALAALVNRRAPVSAAPYRKIVIWTDSTYLVDGYNTARFSWPQSGWMTRDGNPVANVALWKDLVKTANRTGKRVDVAWVAGHKRSRHNKVADKLAKASAQQPGDRRVSVVKVRRKKSAKSVEIGSVRMLGQRATIHIITDERLGEQRLNKYKYEVMSRASPFRGNVDVVYSGLEIYLSAGHTYRVRFNDKTSTPRVIKVFGEVLAAG